MNCRFCKTKLEHVFVDLVNAPISNDFLSADELNNVEVFYPLKTLTCSECKLVQVGSFRNPNELFKKDYVYFSSFSTSWLDHSKKYVDMITSRLSLDETSLVTEIASNDGYLLQYFKENSIPCLGIEPTQNTAKVARDKGIDVLEDFFGKELAGTLKKSDLILGNNVLAHVPDINDFVSGLKIALKSDGTITMEFPHLMELIDKNQFDTIYHEHFSYFSFHTVSQIFEHHGLKVYDVEQIKTHGGSLRIYATHSENDKLSNTINRAELIKKEEAFGLHNLDIYTNFQEKAQRVKNDLWSFLLQAKKEQKQVAAYGAASKGNTLLNYAGVKNDLIDFVVDKSPHKQGMFLPGSHIPVTSEEFIRKEKPSYILILPWNIKEEIINQLSYVKEWDCQFVVMIPKLEIF